MAPRKAAEQARLWEESRHHRRGRNARALGTTVQAMRNAGQLERVDETLVELARTSAGLLDAALADPDESRFVVARLVNEHARSLDMLRALSADGPDSLDELLRELSTPVRDAGDA